MRSRRSVARPPTTIWFPIGDSVAGRSFTPGHLSSGAADCARATAVTTAGPPDSSRPLPAQPAERAADRAAIEPRPPAAWRHHEPCGSHREPASGREGTECASPNAGGKCNKDCKELRQRSSHKRSKHGVQRTQDATADSHAGCRPQQTCGNSIFDPHEGCDNPPQLGYPDRHHDCGLNRFSWMPGQGDRSRAVVME